MPGHWGGHAQCLFHDLNVSIPLLGSLICELAGTENKETMTYTVKTLVRGITVSGTNNIAVLHITSHHINAPSSPQCATKLQQKKDLQGVYKFSNLFHTDIKAKYLSADIPATIDAQLINS